MLRSCLDSTRCPRRCCFDSRVSDTKIFICHTCYNKRETKAESLSPCQVHRVKEFAVVAGSAFASDNVTDPECASYLT